MKKIFNILLISLVGMFSFTACDDLTEVNVDPKAPSEVPEGTLFANATIELFDFMSSTNVNVNNFRLWAQQWAQTTYADESNYDLVTRDVNGRTWRTLYATVIRDLREAKVVSQANDLLTEEQKTNQSAIFEVVEIFACHVLVDIFGDIPYTEAFTDDFTPAYDNDADIYGDLAVRLDAAINNLSGDSGLGGADLIYGGDVSMWRKFANSMKLRVAIRLADIDDATAKTMAEAAVADGVFTSTAESFMIQYQSSTPNTNPLWEDLVQSGRSDFVAANTIIDYMNALNDPRGSYYFGGPTDSLGNLVGGVYGGNNAFNDYSQPGSLQRDPTFPGVVLGYSEVAFLLADAAERGYSVGGTAEEFYNAGVTASILYWGGSQADADAYLAQESVAYGTAAGTWKEKIALQKWISLYDQGFEAWSTYRLYDAPALNTAANTGVPVPNRFTYPVDEFSLNGANVEAAAAAIGGDLLETRVFWDAN